MAHLRIGLSAVESSHFVTNFAILMDLLLEGLKSNRTRKTVPVLSLVDPLRSVVFTKCASSVTRDEFFTHFQELGLDSDFKATFRHLIDFSMASIVELSYNDLSTFYHLHDPFSKENKRALFARRGSTNYGIARMFHGIADGQGIATFDSLSEALSWIGVNPSTLTRDLRRWLVFGVDTDDTNTSDGPRDDAPSTRRSKARGR